MKLDVALIHAPSVYDFRERIVYASIISEVVPSLYVFDMMPYGFLTLASYLEKKGYKVGTFNLASKMLRDQKFDVKSFLRKIEADIYGIDLHWLVHAHGSIEIAKIVKELHPDSKVVLGGLSATYFWHYIMRNYEYIDVIFLGDSAELPLLKFLEGGPEEAPNVVWRDGDRIRNNGISWIPEVLDDFVVDHSYMVRNFIRNRDLEVSIPFRSFIEAPIAGVVTVKGCPFECITCGGSRTAYRSFFSRRKLGLKSPEAIAREVEGIAKLSTMPIFFIGDLRIGDRVEKLSSLLSRMNLENELIFEFFSPPSRRDLELLRKTSHSVYLQISPESPVEEVRWAFGRPYDNYSLEKMIRNVDELEFTRLDLYFMMGLPKQPLDHYYLVYEYFKRVRSISDRVDAFVSPLAPFIDPGSHVFESPSTFGYKLLFNSFEEHRRALTAFHWKYSLNYETDWMARNDIVEASLRAYELLNKAKLEEGLIQEEGYELAKRRVLLDRKVLEFVDRGMDINKLKEAIEELSIKLDVKVKESLSLYPTKSLTQSIRNPLIRRLASALIG